MAVGNDVGDVTAVGGDLAAGAAGGGVGDIPGAKVGKASSVSAKLDNPFGVNATQVVGHVVVGSGNVSTGS